MAEGSDEEHKHPVSLAVTDHSPAYLPFRSFTQPYSQNDLGLTGLTGLTGYSDSTPLALSNDTNSFGVVEKNIEKILSFFQNRSLHRETA